MSIIALGPDSFDDFTTHNPVVVVDFYADWCGPCKQMMRILPNLAAEIQSFAAIGKVEVDQNPSLKERFNIHKIPTFIFFRNGQVVERREGVLRLAEIKAILEELAHLPQL